MGDWFTFLPGKTNDFLYQKPTRRLGCSDQTCGGWPFGRLEGPSFFSSPPVECPAVSVNPWSALFSPVPSDIFSQRPKNHENYKCQNLAAIFFHSPKTKTNSRSKQRAEFTAALLGPNLPWWTLWKKCDTKNNLIFFHTLRITIFKYFEGELDNLNWNYRDVFFYLSSFAMIFGVQPRYYGKGFARLIFSQCVLILKLSS